jgi:hypothetical protein
LFSKEILRVTLGSQLNPVRVRTSQIEAPLIVPSSEVEAGYISASDLNCRLCIPGTRLRNGELLPQNSRNDGICHASNQAVAEIVIKIHTRRLDKGRARTGQQYSHLCRVSRSRGLLDWLDRQRPGRQRPPVPGGGRLFREEGMRSAVAANAESDQFVQPIGEATEALLATTTWRGLATRC